MISIEINIKESVEEIEEKILNKVCLHLNSVFKRAAGAIGFRIKDICDSLVQGTDEYQSLLNGQLLGELGVPDIKPRLDHILKTIKNGLQVQSTPITHFGKTFTGGLVFKIIRSDFLDILELPDAEYVTEKGTTIPWLNWLLLQGDTIIVIGYDVKLNLTAKERYRSRTKLALMERGKGWRVPPKWSGTEDNNFITRAFEYNHVESLLLRIIEDEISSRV